MSQVRFDERSSPAPHANLFGTGSFFQQVTIERLSDDIILNIFRRYLDSTPQLWPRLARVCKRWRQIFTLPAPNLRLHCTYGTPALKTLDCWPTLPIVVEYGGSPALDAPAREDEDNIMAALKHSDRVTSISLTVTSSLLEKLSALEKPFSELEDLVLLSRDSVPLTLSSAFLCGSRLRRLHLTGITSPALLQLLLSSRNLVDLQLHEVLNSSHLPPEALTNALSGMVQLQSLSLHFLSSTPGHHAPPPPSRERVVLQVLSRFNFQGITEYLEDFVARIDAPRLGSIDVTFFNRSNFDLSELREFTHRVGMHKSHCRADILSSKRAISLSLTRPGDPTRLKFQLFRKSLSEQLFFIAQVCLQFSAFLLNVEDLHISAKRSSRQDNGLHSQEWLEPINSFTGVKWLYISGNLSTDIMCSPPDGRPESVLSSLCKLYKLYILQPVPRYVPLREAVVSFMTSRRLSGHPIVVEYERLRHISKLPGTGTV